MLSHLDIISLIYISIFSLLFYNINFVLNPISPEAHPFLAWGYSFPLGTSILIERLNNKGSSLYKRQFIIYANQRNVELFAVCGKWRSEYPAHLIDSYTKGYSQLNKSLWIDMIKALGFP